MMDVSDGLLAEAEHMADESGVAIDVRRRAFDLAEPSSPWEPRSAPTRCSSCSAAATTTCCSRPSRGRGVPDGWLRHRLGRRGGGRDRRRRGVRRPHRVDAFLSARPDFIQPAGRILLFGCSLASGPGRAE